MNPTHRAALLIVCLAAHAGVWAETSATQSAPTDAQDSSATPDKSAALSDWRTTASLEAWFYRNRTDVRQDSAINAGNRLARLPTSIDWLDARINLRASSGGFQFVANPRLTEQRSQIYQSSASDATEKITQTTNSGTVELDQGFMRYQQGDSAFTLGRELFVWGPANFRSPSNQFYFDAGRTNPLAAPVGIDLVRATQAWGSLRVTGAYIFDAKAVSSGENLAHTPLLKIDHQGSNHLTSLIVSQQRGGASGTNNFVGGFTQLTLNDSWLVYAEFASQRHPLHLTPNAPGVPGPLYMVQQPAPRSSDALLGVNYTLPNGQTLIAEYLRNTDGFNASTITAYFAQATAANKLALSQPALGGALQGQALGKAPRLLGRDYLLLNWQSNPQDSGLYWRLGWTQNLNDHSGQAVVYLEKNIASKLSGFLSLAVNRGSAKTEYGALLRTSASVGIKWFIF